METKHTPGPWEYGQNGGRTLFIRDCRHHATVALMTSRVLQDFPDERIANARLIAAAPDLLALAERVAAHWHNTDSPIGLEAARIIARARGES